MQWLKVVFFLFVAISWVYAGPPSSSKTTQQREAQQKLIKIAAAIQDHEAQLSKIENDLSFARGEESAILEEMEYHNQRLMDTIHYLRHATQYSPLLSMLSASKPKDLIHSSMLLRSVMPYIHVRNQQLLEKVTALSQIRTQLEDKQNQLRDITFHYYQQRENLDTLLKNRPTIRNSLEEQAEVDLQQFTLIPPVSGKLIPTYGNPNPEWASFTQGILISTRSGAHVISPISGTIAFSGDYAKGEGKMVIVETQNSHIVMSGMGSLNCTVGQSIAAGEPVGRMPTKKSKSSNGSSQNPRLYLEVWHQEQTVNPQTVLKAKRKES